MTIAIYRTTLRLIFRSVWIYAVTVPILALAWVASLHGRGTAIVSEFFHQPYMLPFFLGQMLAVLALVQGERARGLAEIAEALPYRSWQAVLGRAGALFTAWLGAGSLIYFLVLYRAVIRWRLPINLFPVLDWFLVIAITLIFTTGVAYGIGSLMRRGIGAYLVLLLIVLAGSFPFNQVSSQFFMDGLGAGPFATVDFTLSSYFPGNGVTFFPDLWPLIWNRLHAIGVGIFWLGAAAWMGSRRRREPDVRRAGMVAMAALVAVLLAFTGARVVWAERMVALQSEWMAAETAQPTTAPVVAPPSVAAYQVALTVTPETHSLAAETQVTITAAGETAIFTLNRSFAVQRVTGADGAAVPFVRNGDLLLLATGGKPGTYTVTYEGAVWQWRPDMWNGVRLAAHVAAESIVLPAGLGWYPLPGAQTLTAPGRTIGVRDATVWHPPVAVSVRVSGATGLQVATNADGHPVTSAWLIGTPNAPVDESGIRFFLSPISRGGQRRMAEQYAAQIAWYQKLVPLGAQPQVVEVPASLWAVRSELEPAAGFPGALIVTPTAMMRLDNMRVQRLIGHLWWGDGRTAEEEQVHDVLLTFMAQIYERDVNHRDQTFIALTRFRGEVGIRVPAGQQLLADLRQYEGAHGLAAAGGLLQSLRDAAEPLTFARVSDAIKGAGR